MANSRIFRKTRRRKLLRRLPGGRTRQTSLPPSVNRFLVFPVFLAGMASALCAAPPPVETCGLTIPTPAEFFAALDKAGKPDWASFYREPSPTAYAARPLAAVNLGALVTDGYLAVEAQDGQQVRNTGKDIITLARALGVGEQVLGRGKSITDFADRNDWSALKEELDATTNEVRLALAGQRDEGLATLISAGAWLRALQVGGRTAALSGEKPIAELLTQSGLIAALRTDLEKLPEKTRGIPVVQDVGNVLASLEEQMKTAPEGDFAIRIGKTAGDLVTALAARQK